MNFDEVIDRRGSHSSKWDTLEKNFGISPEDGIAMGTADMDFKPPKCVTDALQDMLDHGILGYYGPDTDYRNAVCTWMEKRHNWHIKPEWITAAHGLGNGTAMCIEAFTEPDDGIIIFTPAYHVFSMVINAAERRLVELPLALNGDKYEMDFEDAQRRLDGSEKMLILCSPHNPVGRVWTVEEQRELAEFCDRNDLILVADEIHHDLVMPGNTHTVLPVAVPEIADRCIVLAAATKTFNIAGSHVGNVIIKNDDMRATFERRMRGLCSSPNAFGVCMTTAAYSEEGVKWLDALIAYLDENRMIFDEAINSIPGLRSIPLEATYLSWVDFSGTGMTNEEFVARVHNEAKLGAYNGKIFGDNGENFMRFNIGVPRSTLNEAIKRLQEAFSDLQ